MAGWLRAADRGGARRRSATCSATTARCCGAASGDSVKLDRAARRGGRARGRGGRREEPRPRRRRAGRRGTHDRHRRGEVRRPVDRSHQGLRVRLGPDAGVRRQHGALPPVRARPDLLDLPPRRGRPRVASAAARSRSAPPQERALALRLLAYPTALDDDARRATARTSCAPTCSTWPQDFTAFYEHCPVLKADEPLRSSRLALCRPDRARRSQHGLGLLGIDAPERM